MEISLNDALLLQNKGNKILFDPPPTHTHAQKGSRIQTKCLSIPVVHDLAPVRRPILRLGLSTLFIQNITFLHPSG